MTEREKLGAKLDPALRAWADKVIIPALAREYRVKQKRKPIAELSVPVTQFESERLSARVTP